MSLLLWVAAIAFVYLAVAKLILLLVEGLYARRWWAIPEFAWFCFMGWVIAGWAAWTFRALPEPANRMAVAIGIAAALVYHTSSTGSWFLGKLTWQDKKRRKELSRQIKLHLALVTGAIVFTVPFYWLVTTSLKPDARTNQFPPDLIPMQQSSVGSGSDRRLVYLTSIEGKPARVVKREELEGDKWEVVVIKGHPYNRTFEVSSSSVKPDLHPVLLWSNYPAALAFLPPEYSHGLRPLWNTVYVTILVILGTVLSSSLVAFSFARLKWPGRDALFVVLIATMMIPPAVTMLPVFLIFRSLNWIDSLKPLWVPALFGSAFNVFLLRQFFLTIPNDLEDAAKIDGCSYFTIYWKIMLPLIKPALAAITIFAFMGSWNNFMGPLIYISSPEKMTLAYALQLFQGSHGGEPAMMMAAATLVMLPVLGVFFFTQRYMIQGVTLTGIKG